MTAEDEETMMPMNEVTAKPTGMVMSWDSMALSGRLANLLKSGLFMIKAVDAWSVMYSSELRTYCWLTSKVGDSAHDTLDDSPCELTALELSRLTNDGTETVCSDNGPDEEGDTSSRCYDRLDREKMADLVDREPQCRQRAQPEEEEADEVASVGTRRLGQRVLGSTQLVLVPAGPDTTDHKVDTSASNPTLYAIPHTGHGRAVEDWPETSPDTETGSRYNRERDVVFCSDTASEDDEDGGDRVSDPDTDP